MAAESPSRPPPFTTRGWTLDNLVKGHTNFKHAPRLSAHLPTHVLLAAIVAHERSGLPLVIGDFHELEGWPSDMFTPEWLVRYSEEQTLNARNVHTWTDEAMSLPDFIHELDTTPSYARLGEKRRLYGKDFPCPVDWSTWLDVSGMIPETMLPKGPNNILKCLPDSTKVETLMCYIGVGDTFTPAHKDLCGSSGQNLMCYTSDDSTSSFWFMTASLAAANVHDFFHSELKQELDHENHVLSIEELAAAPFDVYVVEQRLGDLVFVPPRSCHQVMNHGRLTAKMSWSRMTVKGLVDALNYELPIYRRVGRQETYKVRYTIHQALLNLTQKLRTSRRKTNSKGKATSSSSLADSDQLDDRVRDLKDLRTLLDAFDDILVEEYHPQHIDFAHVHPHGVDQADADGNEAQPSWAWNCSCDFCGADIFQSFFECKHCAEGTGLAEDSDGVLLCATCYVEGRKCRCGVMTPVQFQPYPKLLEDRNDAARLVSTGTFEELREKDLITRTGRSLMVFQAACILHECRARDLALAKEGKRMIRQCTTRVANDPAHPVSTAELANCRKCHAYKCFTHVLHQNGVHAAEALLCLAADKDSATWHARHGGQSGAALASIESRVRSAEQAGEPCATSDALVVAAILYPTCRPKAGKWVQYGYYDAQPLLGEETSEEPEDDYAVDNAAVAEPIELNPHSPPRQPAFRASPSFEHTGREPTQSPSSTSTIAVAEPEKSVKMTAASSSKTRRIMDHVLVPALEASRKRAYAQPAWELPPAPLPDAQPTRKRRHSSSSSESVALLSSDAQADHGLAESSMSRSQPATALKPASATRSAKARSDTRSAKRTNSSSARRDQSQAESSTDLESRKRPIVFSASDPKKSAVLKTLSFRKVNSSVAEGSRPKPIVPQLATDISFTAPIAGSSGGNFSRPESPAAASLSGAPSYNPARDPRRWPASQASSRLATSEPVTPVESGPSSTLQTHVSHYPAAYSQSAHTTSPSVQAVHSSPAQQDSWPAPRAPQPPTNTASAWSAPTPPSNLPTATQEILARLQSLSKSSVLSSQPSSSSHSAGLSISENPSAVSTHPWLPTPDDRVDSYMPPATLSRVPSAATLAPVQTPPPPSSAAHFVLTAAPRISVPAPPVPTRVPFAPIPDPPVPSPAPPALTAPPGPADESLLKENAELRRVQEAMAEELRFLKQQQLEMARQQQQRDDARDQRLDTISATLANVPASLGQALGDVLSQHAPRLALSDRSHSQQPSDHGEGSTKADSTAPNRAEHDDNTSTAIEYNPLPTPEPSTDFDRRQPPSNYVRPVAEHEDALSPGPRQYRESYVEQRRAAPGVYVRPATDREDFYGYERRPNRGPYADPRGVDERAHRREREHRVGATRDDRYYYDRPGRYDQRSPPSTREWSPSTRDRSPSRRGWEDRREDRPRHDRRYDRDHQEDNDDGYSRRRFEPSRDRYRDRHEDDGRNAGPSRQPSSSERFYDDAHKHRVPEHSYTRETHAYTITYSSRPSAPAIQNQRIWEAARTQDSDRFQEITEDEGATDHLSAPIPTASPPRQDNPPTRLRQQDSEQPGTAMQLRIKGAASSPAKVAAPRDNDTGLSLLSRLSDPKFV